MSDSKSIICIGEVLWDSLPSGLFLGGAPLNVSLHLQNLNEKALMISRVGNDRLGNEALRRIRDKGLSTDTIQVDPKYETGFVAVELDDSGTPDYQIVEPVAWDFIDFSDSLGKHMDNVWGIVFGSLAQRNETARNTVKELLKYNGLKIFDINLRPPHINRQAIEESLMAADVLKINEDELKQLSEWFGLPDSREDSVRTLSKQFDCPVVTVTKASNGAELFYKNEWFSHPGFKVKVADTVGAGDAFLAAMIIRIKAGKNGQDIIEFANAAGAYVASQNGATPDYDIGKLKKFISEI